MFYKQSKVLYSVEQHVQVGRLIDNFEMVPICPQYLSKCIATSIK